MKKLFLILPLLSIATSAWAYMQCPVGVDPGGPNNSGVACYWVDEGGDNSDGGGAGGESSPMIHYSEQEWQAFRESIKQAAIQEEQNRMKDPTYRALKQGTWDFAKNKPDSPDKVCQASFLTLHGGVMFIDIVGQQKNGTMLGFFGGLIPKAKTIQPITLSLTQSGQTQTVKAFHSTFPGGKDIGMYLFVVPSTQALLGAIEDKQDYTVSHNGEVMISGKWHSGLKARDWLKACVKH